MTIQIISIVIVNIALILLCSFVLYKESKNGNK